MKIHSYSNVVDNELECDSISY